MRERTILMGGFSKAYAMTGWRVGWLCAPAGILEGIVKVHQYAIMSAPTTAQDAALEALTNGEADVERMLAAYDRRRRLIVDGFNAMGLPTFEPRGAFYAFPQITSTGLDAETFAERLLPEEHVAVVPGWRLRAVRRGPRPGLLRDLRGADFGKRSSGSGGSSTVSAADRPAFVLQLCGVVAVVIAAARGATPPTREAVAPLVHDGDPDPDGDRGHSPGHRPAAGPPVRPPAGRGPRLAGRGDVRPVPDRGEPGGRR